MLYGFVDVFTWAHHPYIVSAVDLQERDVKVQCLVYISAPGGLHLTVLVLVSILWLDGQLTSLLLNHVCIRMAYRHAQPLLETMCPSHHVKSDKSIIREVMDY